MKHFQLPSFSALIILLGDTGFFKSGSGKRDRVLLCCPGWSVVAIHKHNPTAD